MIHWRKSSYSQGDGGNCVEISTNSPAILVRDSKDPNGPWLALEPDALAALITQIKTGDHDL